MQYPIIDNLIPAYLANGWTGLDVLDNPSTRFKFLVDSGTVENYYNIADQLTERWFTYNSPWDIVNFFDNGNVALNWHYSIPDGIQFDAPEAIYYFEGNEAAGTYHIAVGSAYGNGWRVGQNIQFTLTEAPFEGDQLFIDCGTNYANDPTAGRAWRVYEAGTNTVKQSGTTSNGTSGTNLGTIGNVNAHRPNGRLNAISRVVYGYSRWSQSAIRQYLNSTEAAGAWWTIQNPWDRPPSQLASLRGFLAGYSTEFLDIIEAVDVVTALNTQEGFSETTETTRDRIFLPSLQEWYIATQLANVEGEDWDYNKQLAEEDGRTGRFPNATAIDILKRYSISSQSSSVGVWLRSASRADAYGVWYVYTNGGVYYGGAFSTYRGCPACIIQKYSNNSGTNYYKKVFNDISNRLKLPLIKYFPHSVIDALISASTGQQTAEETEILKHYLTPLGIGGI